LGLYLTGIIRPAFYLLKKLSPTIKSRITTLYLTYIKFSSTLAFAPKVEENLIILKLAK